MSMLITGTSGYVGSHLLRVLTAEERQTCLMPSHKELDFSDAGSVEEYFSAHRIDSVIHLAACLDNNSAAELFDGNIRGLYNLLSACKAYGVSYFLYASGNNVYGSDGGRAFSETDDRNPMAGNNYGLSKYCGELLVSDCLQNAGIKHCMMRIADIYGPEQKTGALLKAVAGNIKGGLPQKLYGVGDRVRDYIYIDDVAAGLAFAIRKNLEGTYNLSTGIGTSVAEIVKIAEKLSSCKEPTIVLTVEREDHSRVVLNNNKLKKAGFTPEVTITEGLRRLAEYRGE